MVVGKKGEHLAFELVIAFRGGIVKAKTDGNHLSITYDGQRDPNRGGFIDRTLQFGGFHAGSISIYHIVYKSADLFPIRKRLHASIHTCPWVYPIVAGG